MRGCLTPEIQQLAVKMFDREISTRELRLFCYLDYVWKNNQVFEQERVSDEERSIIAQWCECNSIVMDGNRIVQVYKPFYDAVQAILYEAYVNYHNS